LDLVAQLHRDESLRLTVYDDATGKPIVPGVVVKGNPTIGIGRNLIGDGISTDEADYLLANDISKTKIALGRALPWTSQLDDARRGVLLNMAFNMGLIRLQQFKKTLALMQVGNFIDAADAMLQSAWANEVGDRAHRLANQMRTGIWQ
jgi:lysozyme